MVSEKGVSEKYHACHVKYMRLNKLTKHKRE